MAKITISMEEVKEEISLLILNPVGHFHYIILPTQLSWILLAGFYHHVVR